MSESVLILINKVHSFSKVAKWEKPEDEIAFVDAICDVIVKYNQVRRDMKTLLQNQLDAGQSVPYSALKEVGLVHD